MTWGVGLKKIGTARNSAISLGRAGVGGAPRKEKPGKRLAQRKQFAMVRRLKYDVDPLRY